MLASELKSTLSKIGKSPIQSRVTQILSSIIIIPKFVFDNVGFSSLFSSLIHAIQIL